MQPTADAVGHDLIDGVRRRLHPICGEQGEATPGIDKFLEAYKAKYGTEPRLGHSLNNSMSAPAAKAINAGEGFEPDQMVAAVKALDIPEGSTAAGYGVKFGKNNQNDARQHDGHAVAGRQAGHGHPKAAISEMRFNK